MIECPKVSLIIPVYNVEEYVEKCLSSAINQTLQDVEILVVDDGSTDNSFLICQKFREKDDRITLIRQKNGGLGSARNKGIENAKGEFLAFLDSDDYIDPGMLEVMYNKACRENLDIVTCGYDRVNQRGDSMHVCGPKAVCSKDEHFRMVLSARTYSMVCNKIIKRNLFQKYQLWFPVNMYHEDVDTTYKLFYFAGAIGVVEKAFYKWLTRDGSISNSISSKHIKDIQKIIRNTRWFLRENKIFDEYRKEYTRRGVHFMLGLIDRVNESELSVFDKIRKRKQVWKAIKDSGLECGECQELLVQYDKNLYAKFIAEQKINQGVYFLKYGDEMKRKVINWLLPKGTRRRMIVDNVHGRGSKKATPLGQSSSGAGSKAGSTKKKAMMDVKKTIAVEEKKKLQKLKNKFKGERCFIIGNGPSLNKCDLSLLKNEYTFGVNGIFYKTKEMGFKPTFYMVEDGHVVDDNQDQINEYDPDFKFFPSLYKEKIKASDNTYFFTADLGFYRGDHPSFCKPRFSDDFSELAYCGQSVTYLNLQLAFYLGFKEVYLIGMDFSYSIPGSAIIDGASIESTEDDVNHFHPDYFGKGKKWHDPKVDRVGLNYEFAKLKFEEDDRWIFNATVGGMLEIFERVDYSSLFKNGGGTSL